MKCPTCVETSDVYPGQSIKTRVRPRELTINGVRHIHDQNKRVTEYKCSNGHQWSVMLRRQACLQCSWGHDVIPRIKIRDSDSDHLCFELLPLFYNVRGDLM